MEKKQERLLSIDALRGFDMVWIAGGATLVAKLDGAIDLEVTGVLAANMQHAQWEGFTFLDIIMPLFLFITGCSMVFSFQKRIEKHGRKKVYRHVLQRFVLLWLLGMIYQGNLLSLQWEKIDFFSNTLQAIAIGYLGASLILLLKSIKWQIGATAFLLITYWGLVHFIPGFDLTVEGNFAIYIEQLLFKSHIGNAEYAWILPSLNFTATVMLGVFAGEVLTNTSIGKNKKLKHLIIIGLGLSISGFIISFHDPCIKKLWTSSFTLISGGYCTLLLSIFYGIIDVAGYKKWATPFVVLGKNALLVYMVFAYNRFVDTGAIAHKIVFGVEPYLQKWYPVLVSCLALAILLGIFYYLNKKQTFIKI
jgi:predicted acyltransferase